MTWKEVTEGTITETTSTLAAGFFARLGGDLRSTTFSCDLLGCCEQQKRRVYTSGGLYGSVEADR